MAKEKVLGDAGLYDPDTGFIQFSARDYDPESGRWMSKEPLGFNGGSGNFYSYVSGDPVNYQDPTGLFVDVLYDWVSIGYDLDKIMEDNILGDCDNLGTNLLALGLDVASAGIPFVVGLGAASRAGKWSKKIGCFAAQKRYGTGLGNIFVLGLEKDF